MDEKEICRTDSKKPVERFIELIGKPEETLKITLLIMTIRSSCTAISSRRHTIESWSAP